VELHYRSIDTVNRRDLAAFLAPKDDDVKAVSRIVAVEGALHGHDGIRRRHRRLTSRATRQRRSALATASDVAELLATHPEPSGVDRETLARCIAECFDCARSCTACADADLAEKDVSDMRRCIRLCLDCADVCDATGRVVSRQTHFEPETSRAQVESCRRSCSACAEECERHAQHHEHCRICADTCRRCEEACASLLEAIG
jgi:hypothetical protein